MFIDVRSDAEGPRSLTPIHGRSRTAVFGGNGRARPSHLVLCLVAALLPAIAGCPRNRGPERVVVSGTVTYNGKPIPDGMIQFMPVATSPVPMAVARIANGKYKVDYKGGVPIGTFRVQFEAYREPTHPPLLPPGMSAPPGMGRPSEQYIPESYGVDSKLQITIEPGSGAITKDFAL